MRKKLLLISLIALAATGYAQERIAKDSIKDRVMDSDPNNFNRWTVEVNAGQSKGIKPFASGYYYSDPTRHVTFDINHFSVGARYMVSPRFGVKLDVAYDLLSNQSGSGSLPFEVQQIRAGFQGVVNAVRLFRFEESAGRFGLLMHAGGQVANITPQTGVNEGRDEWNLGIMFGITPQLRVTKSLGVHFDLTMLSNVRQHFNWDGSQANLSNNLAGSMYTASLGMSYSFGNRSIHGDWAVIPEEGSLRMQELDQRIGDLETMLNDSDKDGVPDYLDVENNSLPGVAVDTKGRMVDSNRNGVPDELERYVDAKITSVTEKSNNAEVIKRLINEGYISVFFDFNSSKPTAASTQNLSFLLTYLRSNPNAQADITGYADEVGSAEYNKALAEKRANAVRNTLIKGGINASRLNIISGGEDNSVGRDADGRKLVRRVMFNIKN
jgi:OmpA-OmpF porin, OOP family